LALFNIHGAARLVKGKVEQQREETCPRVPVSSEAGLLRDYPCRLLFSIFNYSFCSLLILSEYI